MPKKSTLLTLQEAADELGVHYMTAYHYVRVGRLPADRSKGRWWVARDDLNVLVRPSVGAKRGHRGSPDWTSHRRRLRARLLTGDSAGAWSVVEDALRGGAQPAAIYVELVGPVLREIGTQWERAHVTVADEHRATAAARRVVGRLGPMFNRRGRTRGAVLIGGAAGDAHELPAAMLSDVVRGAGFAVVDLGANAPIESFVETAQRVSCVAICISAATDGGRATAVKTMRALRAEEINAPTLLGGPSIGAPAASKAGADGWAADAIGAVAEIERLFST